MTLHKLNNQFSQFRLSLRPAGGGPPPITRHIMGDTESPKNTVGDTESPKNQLGDTE
jgi:hypothetical protein